VSRPFASLASIFVEYTNHPLNLVLPMAVMSLFAVRGLKPVDFEKIEIHDDDDQKSKALSKAYNDL